MSGPLTERDILESLDRELEYYRKRNHWLFQYSLVALPAVAYFQNTQDWQIGVISEALVFTLIYIIFMYASWYMQTATKNRIYHLFQKRNHVLKAAATKMLTGFNGPGATGAADSFYTSPETSKLNPSKIYIRFVWVFGGIAILATWLPYLGPILDHLTRA